MSGKEELAPKAGLSSGESRLLSALSAAGKRIITVKDVQATLECSYDNARRIISDLLAKRWLERIAKGKYVIIPLEAGERPLYTEHEFLIASQLTSPYYIGFWSALNFHGLTEQVPYTVFIATTTRRWPVKIHNVTYKFVTLVERKFFGFRGYSAGGRQVSISNPEKTIIDCLDHPEHSGGLEEIAKSLRNARETVSLDRLVEFALRVADGAALKRLRYLLQITCYDLSSSLAKKIEDSLTAGFPLLDPTAPARGKYSSKWMLRLNVPEDRLKGEGE